MLEIKPQFKNKVVQVNGKSTTFSFDLSKNYTQDQLSKFFATDGFKEYIQKKGKEVHIEMIPEKKEVAEFPEMEYGDMQAMSLTKLRAIYPFVKNTRKDAFIDEVIENNYGNIKQ